MPKDGRIFDGSDTAIACDTDTHPSYLPSPVLASAINRSMRGGINRTRPSIRQIAIKGNAEVVSQFQSGNFQGATPYSSIKYGSYDGLVCSIAGNIYFLNIVNNNAWIYSIASGNDPSLLHTWFTQAEDWLYVQNGKQAPLAWSGLQLSPATRLLPLNNQMPIGTIMAYAHGRVWVSDRKNNIYASDIIYGNGFTETSNTQNFTEQNYWNEGGSFTPPSQLGNITGMYVMPYIGANTRGQGELVVLCENGAFTIDGSISRGQWIDTNIQRVALIGRGCVSPWSTCGVNNELLFRASDGWSLFTNSQSEFVNSLSYRKLSREMSRWINEDTPWLRQFASAMFIDNRAVCTVGPYTVTNKTQGQGLHRPHRGMIVLDLDQMTSSSPDSGLNFRWDGLWTGPRPTQVLSAQIRGQKRGFIFSFDADGKNRLYEMTNASGDDFVENQSKPIKSYFITKRYDFSASGQSNKFYNKEINGGELWMGEIKSQCAASASFRADSYPCWEQIMRKIKVGCRECEKNLCSGEFSRDRYKRLKFTTPEGSCSAGSDKLTTIGAEFQLLVELEGSLAIDRLRISSDTRGNVEDMTGDCVEDETNCQPITCCPIKEYDYYKLIE